MSNGQLTFVAVAVLAIHLGALAAALVRREPKLAFGLNLVVAGIALALLALDPKWLRAPIDWQVVGFAAFEVAVGAMAVLALRTHRAARIGSWIAFVLHLLASGLAVAFVLTFKIDRLI